ncbi:DUF3562 domain-containing protein [Burkholderia sp. Ac-20353]|uniref:DUF3562 domain-containing protein n=1 Tax=Burkholderia sp. Ac-20353 TaxID=2703894 RepID=UPI00197C49C0|nr:DUF3562 domain-containing protein [Burkholderia sp. Ac-20353]MBN3790265.1 DUF3562 domain-containing protein [Burkholderia sp. Ac-20353]
MSQDNLFESLKEIATQRSIGADQLRQMIDDEVRALSSEARVHDYIHVFAIRHLRERMRHLDDEAASDTPGHPDDTPVVHARHRL